MSLQLRGISQHIPPPVRAAWQDATRVTGTELQLLGQVPGQTSWVGMDDRHFVYLAEGPGHRGRIRLEAERRAWAARHAIPVPPVVATAPDHSWMITGRVAVDPPEGEGYVLAAAATAAAFAAATDVPPAPDGGEVGGGASGIRGRGRRRRPWQLPLRLLKMLRGRIDVREFLEVRRQVLALPAEVIAHGDFHPGNVLLDAAADVAHAVDLESVGPAPAGTDLLTMWCELQRPADRDAVLELLLADADADRRRELALVHRWLALRTLADRVIAPRRYRDERRIRFAAARAAEARRDAAAWTR